MSSPQDRSGAISEIVFILLALALYLMVGYAASLSLVGMPGKWSFVLMTFVPLPIAVYALRYGSLRVRGNVRPIGEITVAAAAVMMSLLALWGTNPGVDGSVAHLPAGMLAAVLIAVAEEVLFRGAMLPVLSRKFGFAVGILLSSLMFGALHLQSSTGAGLAAVLAGCALGGLYLRSGLGACVTFHAAFNILCGPIFGLSLGGLPWPGLLSPAFPYDPLNHWPVQIGFVLLAVLWVPGSIINPPAGTTTKEDS